MLALVGATLLDGQGTPPRHRSVVLIEGDRIAAVGTRNDVMIPAGAEVKDLEGCWVLPGLIDAHIHLGRRSLNLRERVFVSEALWAARATQDLERLLLAGFTTVRDCGGTIAISLREAVKEGSIRGPRIVAVGRFIERTGGADDPCFMPVSWATAPWVNSPRLADGVAECRRAVREQLRDGADWIKTCTTGAAYNHPDSRTDISEWSPEELHALVDEAHRLGVRVAIHAHAAKGTREAIDAGADTIEHGTCIDADGCRIMAERGLYLIPTFLTLHRMATVGSQFGAPAFAVEKARALDEQHAKTFRMALAAGVPIAMGTDCSGTEMNPHGDNAAELALMVNSGMKPMDAITATTGGAARALGLSHEIGTLASGHKADIIAITADPLKDIQALRTVAFVMKEGKVVHDKVSGVGQKPRSLHQMRGPE